MKIVLLASAALLAACNRPIEPPANNQAANAVAAKPSASPPAEPFVLDEENELVDFHFAWPREAAAVPQLVARFQKEMEKAREELVEGAKEDKSWRDKEGVEFHPFQSSTDYTTAGQSSRLLSLSVEVSAYTGGAHGNHGTNALLWDRQTAIEIKVADLFAEPANRDRLLTQRWCDAINQAREEKRGVPISGGGMFDECPKLDEIAVVPTDHDGNGRFEELILTASPYVAGPYSEGSYEVDLTVTPDLIAALKANYRASFEPGQPQ